MRAIDTQSLVLKSVHTRFCPVWQNTSSRYGVRSIHPRTRDPDNWLSVNWYDVLDNPVEGDDGGDDDDDDGDDTSPGPSSTRNESAGMKTNV
jgi:hypothetical protein